MFNFFNTLFILVFVAALIWAFRDSVSSSIMKSKYGVNASGSSPLIFNLAAAALLAWFCLVGAGECLYEFFSMIYNFL
jgi:hypothetical protein